MHQVKETIDTLMVALHMLKLFEDGDSLFLVYDQLTMIL